MGFVRIDGYRIIVVSKTKRHLNETKRRDLQHGFLPGKMQSNWMQLQRMGTPVAEQTRGHVRPRRRGTCWCV